MKKRTIWILVIVLLTALIVTLLWRSRRLPITADERKPEPALAAQPQEPKTEAAGTASPSVPPIPPTQKPSPELKRTIQTLNHNPIEFYGRALDQFGNPVAGAEVSGVVLYNTGTKAGEKESKTSTDAEGYFRFANLEGQDLGISITKDGYEYRSRNSSFSYSYFEAVHKRHIPDPKNPVVFTLWKKQGAEALVHYDKSWRIPADGTPVRINLLTGKVGGQEADLNVVVTRAPLHMRRGERGFEWKVTIDVIDGGLVRAGEQDYYNVAPVDGYMPRFEHVQSAQSLRDAQEGRIKWTWAWDVSERFFITSRNGQNFARVELRIQPNADRDPGDDQAALDAVVWLNPNGSRNLEFDRSKLIKPKP